MQIARVFSIMLSPELMWRFALTSIAFAVLASPASAQFNGGMDWVVNRTRVPTIIQCPGCNGDDDEDAQQKLPVQVPPSASALIFTPSKAVRQKNLARFVEESRAHNPQGAELMAQFFSKTDVIEQIGAAMRPVGLRVNNVADAYTVWWIAAWEAVNQTDAGSSSAMYTAVKNQAAQAILKSGKISGMSAATKQEMAESLLVQAFLIQQAQQSARGDANQGTSVARAVNEGAKRTGLDLTKMTLTEDGFVPRNGGRSDASDRSDDTQLAANDAGGEASAASFSDYALYAAAGTGLLAGVFAIGKGLTRRG